MTRRYPELGTLTIGGHVTDPARAFTETRDAERLGFGSVWVSERFSAKNADVLTGAAAALSGALGIAAGLIQNLPTRHPIVTAGYGATMARLTDGRFALGIGRGTDSFADATGTPRVNFRIMEDYIGILRQLWRGETVNYTGPLGSMTNLRLGVELPVIPPIIVASQGDKTLEWAGGIADGVLFNSLWTPQAVRRCTDIVRRGAERAGRDPASVRVWTILVSACDVSEEKMLNYVVRRMNTYLLFPQMFDGLVKGNGWDPAVAPRLREKLRELDAKHAPGAGTMGDESTTRDLDDLRRMAELYPPSWLADGVAIGSGADGARAALARFDAGADSVCFHGSPPGELASMIEAWGRLRPQGMKERPVNPGL